MREVGGQTEEDGLPAIPGHDSHDQPAACSEHLAGDTKPVIDKRPELHSQEFRLLILVSRNCFRFYCSLKTIKILGL